MHFFSERTAASQLSLTVLLLVVALVLPPAGRAADQADKSTDGNSPMPRCGPPTDGQVYCKFGVIYECQLIDPNSMERRTGWRWKADILRSCPREKPAAVDQWGGVAPIVTYLPSYIDRPCTRPSLGSEDKIDGTSSVGTMRVHPDAVGCR